MQRRNFLSLVSCAALSAIVPKRTYFFLDGLWRPDEQPIMPKFYHIQLRFSRDFIKSEYSCDGVTWHPFYEEPNLLWHGEVPLVRLPTFEPLDVKAYLEGKR